jgi:RHS repeat-associated protein
MTRLPHLTSLAWNEDDQLQQVDLGGGGTAFYVYDGAGKRVRKVVERRGNLTEERIYLGGFETFRRKTGGGLRLERETLHVMDGQRRIALIEMKTREDGTPVSPPDTVIRYQLDNHLGSSIVEVDGAGLLLSYEEYYPYGETSYHSARGAAETSLKRYRYTGKERDDETRLYYYGARQYIPWLGRWASADPAGMADGPNLFAYVSGNPVRFIDTAGSEQSDAQLMWQYLRDDFWRPKELLSYTPLGWSKTDWKNAGATLVGYAKGVGKVVAAPGVLTYYATGSLLYQTDPSFYSHYKEQHETFGKIAQSLKGAAQSPAAAGRFLVEGFTSGLEQMKTSLEQGDAAGAGEGLGTFVGSVAMAAEGGQGGKLNFGLAPAEAASVSRVGFQLALTAPPSALPAGVTLMASAANKPGARHPS